MSNLDFEAFLKKYALAISYLEKRLSSKEAKVQLAKVLYQDAVNNRINMDNIMTDVRLFYQGNTLSQVKLNNYVKKYK